MLLKLSAFAPLREIERYNMNWIAFFTGLFVGVFVGIFVMCLCRIAAEADKEQEEYLKFHKESIKYENKKG